MVTAHARQVFSHHTRVGFFEATCEVGNDAFERVLLAHAFALRCTRLYDVTELDVFFTRAPENDVTHVVGQRLEGGFHIEGVMLGQTFQHAEIKTIATVPAFDGATGQAQRRKGHHTVDVKHFGGAQAIAGGASAHGRVERKQARLKFGN